MEIQDFEIPHPGSDTRKIVVRHSTETFDFELNGTPVSLINNGDNSWSIVEGTLDQETANLIGDAIETKIREFLAH